MAAAQSIWSFVRPPRRTDTRDTSGWSAATSGRSWDIFGFPRTAWTNGEDAAWDCFGYHIWTVDSPAAGVPVLVQQTQEGQRSAVVTRGDVTALFLLEPGDENPYVTVRIGPRCSLLCGFGLELVASVRRVKHWLTRWRRGMRAMRKHHASMVLGHALPGVPEVVRIVHSFL